MFLTQIRRHASAVAAAPAIAQLHERRCLFRLHNAIGGILGYES